ncbi:MAG: type VI secretion system baseplate subunit TssE [Treponema sp.]|jgi:type VI secretion system lysozyme-like protein|nr:type VI secretion system baseplate subunit TssE [Treponema sp.]
MSEYYKIQEDARYKPNVLKRLTDFEPFVKKERMMSAISAREFKEDVFQNIEMLFNSRSHLSLKELKGYEELDNSVLGYGISDYCGGMNSPEAHERLKNHIITQLRCFEPRFAPDSIAVDFVSSDASANSLIEFKISGLIQVDQVSEEVLFISKLDLETGNAEISF